MDPTLRITPFSSPRSLLSACCATASSRTMLLAAATPAANAPTVSTKGWPAKPWPDGMVWIPGGEFWMGSDEPDFGDARPWHRVYVDGFWMDATEVTNEQFGKFVKAAGYVTVAERKPRAALAKRPSLEANWLMPSLGWYCPKVQYSRDGVSANVAFNGQGSPQNKFSQWT